MRVAELKYFEAESSLRRGESQSKSLNPYLLPAVLFQQNTTSVFQQLRIPKVDLSIIKNEYTNICLTYIPDKRNAFIGNVVGNAEKLR